MGIGVMSPPELARRSAILRAANPGCIAPPQRTALCGVGPSRRCSMRVPSATQGAWMRQPMAASWLNRSRRRENTDGNQHEAAARLRTSRM